MFPGSRDSVQVASETRRRVAVYISSRRAPRERDVYPSSTGRLLSGKRQGGRLSPTHLRLIDDEFFPPPPSPLRSPERVFQLGSNSLITNEGMDFHPSKRTNEQTISSRSRYLLSIRRFRPRSFTHFLGVCRILSLPPILPSAVGLFVRRTGPDKVLIRLITPIECKFTFVALHGHLARFI